MQTGGWVLLATWTIDPPCGADAMGFPSVAVHNRAATANLWRSTH